MDKLGREDLVAMYRPDVERLAYFLPWLEGKTGKEVTSSYQAEGGQTTMPFPVYDEILLSFLNELSTTIFIDYNYRYFYTRHQVKNYKDELAWIEKADIMTMDILKAILSKYMLGGMTKGYLWTQGIEYRVFVSAVRKAKSIIEFWDVPLDIRTIDMDLAQMQEPEYVGEDVDGVEEALSDGEPECAGEDVDGVEEALSDGEPEYAGEDVDGVEEALSDGEPEYALELGNDDGSEDIEETEDGADGLQISEEA